MSLNAVPLKIKRTIPQDLFLNAIDKMKYSVADGGEQVNVMVYPSNNLSNSTIQFNNIAVNSLDTVVCPDIRVKAKFRVVLNAVDDGKTVIKTYGKSYSDAPRSWPLHKCANSVEVALNSRRFATDPREYLDVMERLGEEFDMRNRELSTFPSQPDEYLLFSQGRMANNNPLGSYSDNVQEPPRGAYIEGKIISNTNTQAVVEFTTFEPVIVSPLWYNTSGFINLRTLSVNYQLGELSRCWSREEDNKPLTSIQVQMLEASLHVKMIQPKILEKIPRQSVYKHYRVLPINVIGSPVVAGGSATLRVSTTPLASVPKSLVIVVKKSTQDKTYTDTDTYMRINRVSIQYNQRTDLLGNLSPESLYLMSARNGVKMNYIQWSSKCGSVLVVKPSYDFGLSNLESAGVNSTPTIGVQVDFTNLYSSTTTPQLYVYAITEGSVTNIDGNILENESMLTSKDVKDSFDLSVPDELESSPFGASEAIVGGAMSGGAWWDFAKKAYDWGKSTYDKVAPYVKPALEVAKVAKSVMGAGRKKMGGELTAGELTAGKMLSKQDLKELMKEY